MLNTVCSRAEAAYKKFLWVRSWVKVPTMSTVSTLLVRNIFNLISVKREAKLKTKQKNNMKRKTKELPFRFEVMLCPCRMFYSLSQNIDYIFCKKYLLCDIKPNDVRVRFLLVDFPIFGVHPINWLLKVTKNSGVLK